MPETSVNLCFPLNRNSSLLPSAWFALCGYLFACFPAYEDEDELLWSPGVIPDSKVRSFLLDVLSRTTDEKLGYDKPGIHVRDNEQVSNVFNPSFVAQ